MRTLTALFVGLGSIGTRHLKNLANLCADRGWTLQADALRSDPARRLRDGVAALGYPFPVPSPSNQQFPVLPNTVLQQLQDKGYAYELDHVVDDAHTCVRFCTSWATPVEAVDQLLKDLAACK